jgi:DNA-binding CsgD family transcriptional regulator
MNKKTRNYRSASTPATLRKQAAIRELLALVGEGLTVKEIGKALGMSRQLALYHVKKMAATYQLAMILEPCLGNGGLQFKVWDEMALAAHYAAMLAQSPRTSYVRELAA